MTTKKTILTTLFLLVAGTVAMYGQIPAEVTDLIEKSKAKMHHASGVTMEMNIVALRRHSSRQGAHRRPDVRRRVFEQPV